MVFTHFVLSFTVSLFTFAVIMLIRKVFQRRLSAKWQYNLWFLLLLALTLPFIANHLFHLKNNFITYVVNQYKGITPAIVTIGDQVTENQNWMQDFAISVNRSSSLEFLNSILLGAWIAGMFVLTALAICAWLKIKSIRSTTSNIKNKQVLYLFASCQQSLNIRRNLIVGESALVRTPMTFGLFKTYVVLPVNFAEWLSIKEIEYIFLHELNHCKYKDIIINYLLVIYQILYWFSPFVWIAFREMRLDREIACDAAVLSSLDKYCYTEYGNTIINFIDRASKPINFVLASQLNGSREQIKRRIKRIATFTPDSKLLKLNSIAIFMLVAVIIASQIPFVSAMGAVNNNFYNFKSNKTVYEDLGKYFGGYKGSFVLYDMQSEQYNIYNKSKSELRVSPDSTYKIYIALFALESDIITGDNSAIKWDGIKYPYDAWNTDQNLFTAMKKSVNWYFQELDRRINGRDIQAFLEQIGYGNGNLSGGPGEYWLESSLKISPVEQVRLLRDLYTNQFGFKEKNIQIVKNAIKLETRDGAILSGKTGTGTVHNKNTNGWFIGFVEVKGNIYFFATNIQSKDNSNGSKAAEITLSILRDKGIY